MVSPKGSLALRKLAVVVVFLASGGALAVWLTWNPVDELGEHRSGAGAAVVSGVTQENGIPEVAPVAKLESTPVEAQASERQAVAESPPMAVLRGQVTTADGVPVEGAIVSWIAWDPEFTPFVTSSVEIPPARILAARVLTETGAAGEYYFTATPALAEDQVSFVHITHPGHSSVTIELEPGGADPGTNAKMILPVAAPMSVVVHRAGQPVAGARVFQQASYPRDSSSPFALGLEAPKGRLLFLRVYEIDEVGGLEIAGSEYPQRLWAETDQLRSRDWLGNTQPEVKLELFPCFELSGTVLFPDPLPDRWSPEHFGTATIQVQRIRGTLVEEVASLAVDENGHFGSSQIPLLSAESYRVSLMGSLFVPTHQVVPVPEIGDTLWLEFQPEVGHLLWFLAQDSEGAPIPNAEVHGRWEVDERQHEARYPGRPDGYVLVAGLPAGGWEGSIGADGYASVDLGVYALPEEESFVRLYILTPGATLTGQCLAGINPQEDFELRYWVPGSLRKRASQQVIGSKDGMFVVEDLPGSQVSICAIGPGFERSETQTIQLSTNTENKVLLVLGEAGEMRGRIIDAATGLGIEDSRAEVYSTHIMGEMDPIGDAVQATGDGQFEVRRLARGINVVCFRAPGYSSRELKVWFDGNDVDLGDIELTALHPLTARLILPEGGDPTRWILLSDGITTLPPTPFDERGELRIEQCHAGVYTFEVGDIGNFEPSLAKQSAWLKEGEPWHLEFDLRNGPALTVTTSGEAINGQSMWARVTQKSGPRKDRLDRSLALDKDGKVRFSGLGPGPAHVYVYVSKGMGSLSGSALLEITEDSPAEIVVDVPLRRSKARVRIVDSAGNPQPNIQVRLHSSRMPGFNLGVATSNSQGLCTFKALHADVDRASLNSVLGGVLDNIPFKQSGNPSDVIELVFDTDAGLEVHIADGGVPQPLTTARLLSTDGITYVLPGRSPDGTGFLALDNLGEGKYQLHVTGIGHWPVSMPVEATKSHPSYNVDIRRTGSLTLQFREFGGAPLVGAQIALEFVPFAQSVQGWINKGQLGASPNALTTDSTGTLSLTGLPHGTYRWSYALHKGEVGVLPGELVSEEVRLP